MSPRPRPTVARRLLSGFVTLVVLTVLAVVNRPMVVFGAEKLHEFQISRPSYTQKHGYWSRLPVPADFRVNAIHAALLHTGKVLIIAGSGNDRENFEAGTFRTVLYDPALDKFTEVPTPTDVFCAGHTFLANGNLLVAGGTKSYEVLEKDIANAAGVMKIKNESAVGGPRFFPKGTRLTGKNGFAYLTRADVTVPAAVTMKHGDEVMTHAGEAEVWVDAELAGDTAIVRGPAQYALAGLTGDDRRNLYGLADKITREKQEYGGDNTSYEFDPNTERYIRTGNMVKPRWYPTLAETPNGDVLAVSGLDGFGRMLPGNNERYLAGQRRWVDAPELTRVFPTYPGLHLMQDGRLFFSGSNSGYGSDTEGRTPGLWDLTNNRFQTVPGLPDSSMTETSSSVLLAPAQDQKVMIFGGGEIGESPVSTARTAIADLDEPKPTYGPGPTCPNPPATSAPCSCPTTPSSPPAAPPATAAANTRARPAATCSTRRSTTPPATASPAPPTPPSAATTTPRRSCCPTAGSSPWAATRSTTPPARTPAPSNSGSRSTPRRTCSRATGPRWPTGPPRSSGAPPSRSRPPTRAASTPPGSCGPAPSPT